MSEETKEEQVGEKTEEKIEQVEESLSKDGKVMGIVTRDDKGRILPGSILNPEGMKKGSISFTTMIKNKLKELSPDNKVRAEKIIDYIIDEAEAGNEVMIKMIWAYIDGMPRQRIGVGGLDEEGELTSVIVRVIRTPEDLKKLNEERTNNDESL